MAAPEPATDISRANAGTDADQQEGATLAAVACTSPGPCISVGSYKDSKGFQIGLIDVLDRGTWGALAAPEPSTDSLAGQPGNDATGEAGTALKSATCAPAGLCIAVGTYNDSKGNSVGLIDMLTAAPGAPCRCRRQKARSNWGSSFAKPSPFRRFRAHLMVFASWLAITKTRREIPSG